MTHLKFKYTLYLLFAFTNYSLAQNSAAKAGEYTKMINKEFSIAADGEVSLKNSYGKVETRTWNQNKVKLDIKITVEASSKSKADDLFDRININFSNSNKYVSAETVIRSGNTSWWGNWGWNSDKKDYKIDYEVYLPSSNKLNLTNKYGDSFLAGMEGPVTADISYGNLQSDGVNNSLDLKISYGNGTINHAKDANINLRYCTDLRIKEAENMVFNTSYSEVRVEKAVSIRTQSRYDEYQIGQVIRFRDDSRYSDVELDFAEELEVVAKYTDYEIERVGKQANFDMQYGSVEVQRLDKGFTEFIITGGYSDVEVEVEKGASYKLDASGNYTGISYPSGFRVVREIEKNRSHEIVGYMGTNDNPSSVIKARMSYGSIEVK